MNDTIIPLLIVKAKERMSYSNDPIHDIRHLERVVGYAAKLARDLHISKPDTQAIILAAWWHDVARTITKRPSLIWMPFVDDMLSAFMLGWEMVRSGYHNRTTILALRLILCKSLGTGAGLTKIFLKKQDRILMNILKDADALDVFTIERIAKLLDLIDASALYRMGYRIVCRWYSIARQIKMKTEAARKYVIELIKKIIAWLKEPRIFDWHVKQYGRRWTRKSLRRLEYAVRKLERLALPVAA